jgi:outer membrane protein TolC
MQSKCRSGRIGGTVGPLGPAVLLLFLLLTGGCGLAVLAEEDAAARQTAPSVARMGAQLSATGFGQDVAGAVRAHPEVAGRGAQLDAARADLDLIRAGARPQISLGADAGLLLVGGVAGSARVVPVLEASQLLFDAGATRARLRAGHEDVLGRQIDREALTANLALDAVAARIDLRHQRSLLHLADDNLAEHRALLDRIRDRVQAGAGSDADRLSAESRLADAMARRAAIRSDLDRAEVVHAELFGASPGTGTVPPAPDLPSGAVQAVIASSPRVRGVDARIAAATATRDAVQASAWPVLSLDVEARRPDTGTEVSAAVRPRAVLAGGGQRAAMLARADAEIASLLAERQAAEREVARALAFARSDRQSGQARLDASRAARAANAAAQAAARDQFDAGRRDTGDLLEAQRDLFLASVALAEAERALLLSGYAALALTGDILDVFGLRADFAAPEEAP